MQEPTRRCRRGRLARELLPIGAAAGAAALAVTIIVGGTTAELVSPAQQGPWPVATSPVPTASPPIVTNAPAPQRPAGRARSAGDFNVELAAGPVAFVAGSLAGLRPALGNARDGRSIALVPPTGPPSGDLERAAPSVVAVVAPAPAAPVATTPAPTMVTATAPAAPGNPASAKGRTLKPTPPRGRSSETVATSTLNTAGAASGPATVDPAKGGDHGQGRGHGPESAPGQTRATERSSERSQAR